MEVPRSGTNSSGSKYSNNFQLIKVKTHNTKANPQQAPYYNSYASDNNSRYDYMSENKKQADVRQKQYSYRVRKSVGRKNSYKSQNGRTVYEIYNIRNKNNNDTKSYQREPTNKSDAAQLRNDEKADNNTFSSKSEVIFIDHKHKVLATDKKITQPQLLQPSPPNPHPRVKDYEHVDDIQSNSRSKYYEINSMNRINIRRNRPLYFQKQWNMNEAIKTQNNSEVKIGTIMKQQISKQTPLNPSKPQDISKMLQRQSIEMLQKISQEDAQDATIQHSTKKRKVKNNEMLCDKQLIHRLNLRTKYYRFKHNERIKQKLEEQSYKINSINNYMSSNSSFNHQKLYLSKNPSFAKIHEVQFTHLSKVQDIIKALHHINQNRLRISLKVPKIFHSVPDQLLPLEQLKFKAVMIFQELGIMRPGLICEHDQIKVIKHSESLTFLYDCQANIKDDEGQIKDKYRNNGKFCINWYSDGSVYMGQLENDYRQGLALEWVPGVYVYFGQYEQNYRHGYGVMKYNNKQVYIGVWSYDCYHGYGKLIDDQGWVIKQGVFRNSQIKIQGEYNQLS